MNQHLIDQIEDCEHRLGSAVALTDVLIAVRSRGGTPHLSALFEQNPELNVAIWAKSASCTALAQKYTRIPPILDDMAQIIGTHAPVLDEADTSSLHKALSRGGACIVKTKTRGTGLLAAANNTAHAAAALLVLEKSAKVFLEAQQLGGAKPIKSADARRMHQAYQKTYSQLEQGNSPDPRRLHSQNP